jgi:hypothetical protein
LAPSWPPAAAGLRVLAFPEAINVTEATAAMFPERHPLLQRPKALGWPKRQVWADKSMEARASGSAGQEWSSFHAWPR